MWKNLNTDAAAEIVTFSRAGELPPVFDPRACWTLGNWSATQCETERSAQCTSVQKIRHILSLSKLDRKPDRTIGLSDVLNPESDVNVNKAA